MSCALNHVHQVLTNGLKVALWSNLYLEQTTRCYLVGVMHSGTHAFIKFTWAYWWELLVKGVSVKVLQVKVCVCVGGVFINNNWIKLKTLHPVCVTAVKSVSSAPLRTFFFFFTHNTSLHHLAQLTSPSIRGRVSESERATKRQTQRYNVRHHSTAG